MDDTKTYSEDDVGRLLAGIAGDHRSGAAELLQRAAAVYASVAASEGMPRGVAPAGARAVLQRISSGLLAAQPFMAQMANLAATVDRAAGPAHQQVLATAARVAADFAQAAVRNAIQAGERARRIIRGHRVLLTHSRSSTVAEALRLALADNSSLSIIVTESRPGFEGRSLARELASQGAAVRFIADAAAALLLDQAELVLVGADAVTSSSVINKIGTHMIALAASEKGKPLYAVTDSLKFVPDLPSPPGANERDAAELWDQSPERVSVLNLYFEPVPIDLFTGIITERGVLPPREAAKLASQNTLP